VRLRLRLRLRLHLHLNDGHSRSSTALQESTLTTDSLRQKRVLP